MGGGGRVGCDAAGQQVQGSWMGLAAVQARESTGMPSFPDNWGRGVSSTKAQLARGVSTQDAHSR